MTKKQTLFRLVAEWRFPVLVVLVHFVHLPAYIRRVREQAVLLRQHQTGLQH